MTGFVGTVTGVTEAVSGLAPIIPECNRQRDAAWGPFTR
jgi:hypothetical protein